MILFLNNEFYGYYTNVISLLWCFIHNLTRKQKPLIMSSRIIIIKTKIIKLLYVADIVRIIYVYNKRTRCTYKLRVVLKYEPFSKLIHIIVELTMYRKKKNKNNWKAWKRVVYPVLEQDLCFWVYRIVLKWLIISLVKTILIKASVLYKSFLVK